MGWPKANSPQHSGHGISQQVSQISPSDVVSFEETKSQRYYFGSCPIFWAREACLQEHDSLTSIVPRKLI